MKLGNIVSKIEAQTGIVVRSSRRIVTGWEYLVLEINGRYIFRIPYSPDRWPRLKSEVSLVNSLSSHVSVPLPQYEFMAQKHAKDFQPFAGYQKLEGVPCNAANFRMSWTESLGPSLGKFLSELHSIDTSDRAFRKLERQSPRSRILAFRRRHKKIRELAFPLIDRADQEKSEKVWIALLRELRQTDFEPSLVHDDLMGSNILVNQLTGKLTGILDWSDAKVGDPAADFAGLMSVNRKLGELALEHYKGNRSGLRERSGLYLSYIPLSEITWGVSQGSKRIIRIGLSNFRRWTLPARPPPA